MSVTLTKTMDIDVYKVFDEAGSELDFDADLDRDGDIVITLEQAGLDLYISEYIKELLVDEENLRKFIENYCDVDLEDAVVTIIKELQSRGSPLRKLRSLMETSK